MKLTHRLRRRGTILSLLAATTFAAGVVQAQSGPAWPTQQPIRLVVGYAPGGPTDVTARMIAPKLGEALGQTVVVENRAGAGSNIASELVAAAAPDGYTLLLAAAPITMNPALYKNLKFDPVKSFEAVINLMSSPSVFAVAPNSPTRDIRAFLERAKKEPGKLTFSSSGNGGSQHLAGEMLSRSAGISLIHVPYKGAAPALNDLMGGQVDAGFQTATGALPQLKAGRAIPIAVTSLTRLAQLPDVPTFAEVGLKDVVVESWNGVFAPAGTPKAVVERLNSELQKILKRPDVLNAFNDLGGTAVGGTSAEFAAYVADETRRWAVLIRSVGMQLN